MSQDWVEFGRAVQGQQACCACLYRQTAEFLVHCVSELAGVVPLLRWACLAAPCSFANSVLLSCCVNEQGCKLDQETAWASCCCA
jgi:hypothetical protein